jgi:hypothetical protein
LALTRAAFSSNIQEGLCWYHQLGTVYTVKWTACMLQKQKVN